MTRRAHVLSIQFPRGRRQRLSPSGASGTRLATEGAGRSRWSSWTCRGPTACCARSSSEGTRSPAPAAGTARAAAAAARRSTRRWSATPAPPRWTRRPSRASRPPRSAPRRSPRTGTRSRRAARGHPWLALPDEGLLVRLGALAREGGEGPLLCTRAGLLMFGHGREVVREFPSYFLDYRERYGGGRWSDRVVTGDGERGGNVFDFWRRVSARLTSDLGRPFSTDGSPAPREGAGGPATRPGSPRAPRPRRPAGRGRRRPAPRRRPSPRGASRRAGPSSARARGRSSPRRPPGPTPA